MTFPFWISCIFPYMETEDIYLAVVALGTGAGAYFGLCFWDFCAQILVFSLSYVDCSFWTD
jgi:hypothetical protein